MRRRLVINDTSRTVSSKSRKRLATEVQESAAAKVAKTSDDLGTRDGHGRQANTTTAAVGQQTSVGAPASSKQRSVRTATSGAAPAPHRAVLRIAQPDGTVCFLAIDNVSDISRLPVTAVVQQLLASQKQASANHRLSLAGSRLAGPVPGIMAHTSAPQVTTTASRPAAAILPRTCLLYTSPSPRDGLLSRMPSSA